MLVPMADLLSDPAGAPALGATLLALLARPRFWARQRTAVLSAEQIGLLAERSDAALFLVDTNGCVTSMTANGPALLGRFAERAPELKLPLTEVLQLAAPNAFMQWLQSIGDAATQPTLFVETRPGEHGVRCFELRARTAGPGRFALEVREVTEREKERSRLETFSRMLDQCADAVMLTNTDGTIEYVNAAFELVSGYNRRDIVGGKPSVLKSGRHRADYYQRMWATVTDGGVFRGEIVNRRRSGELYHEDLSITPLRDDTGSITHYLVVGRDISARKQLENEIEDKAFFDPLTGLANLRLLRERSKQILALARRHGNTAALLHVDLDRLRTVNDSLGRSVGDDVLRKVADRLRQSLRESDTLARLSSDEYIVLLSEVAEEEACARVVRRLSDTVCKPFQIGAHHITLGASIGVALYPQDATTFDELLANAEQALERARTQGATFEFYRPEQSAISHERLGLEDDMRWAWEHEQFVLHYQPILAAASGRMVGAEALTRGSPEVIGMEALARWPHTERGLMGPDQFIPLAEKTGRIVSLDRWAIATAAKQASAWAKTGWTGWISVNLSARSLHDPDLASYVKRTVEVYGIERGRLVLEITESAAMRDPSLTAQLLADLKRAGVLVALDDFGIGHSSLAYLKNFPVDLLKLDQSFIREIGGDPRNEHLLEIMISLAHRMGAQIVAEGVEKQHQLDWLRAAGCDYIQGYLMGRPAPASEVVPGTEA